MCGILGSINRPFDNEALEKIHHRGPDDYGLETIQIGTDVITLGHRRLSIVDTSMAGHQPMSTGDGKNKIIFNGEIYNHLDLKSELSSVTFKGHSDTETILYYIAKNGINSISDFNGIFAFAFLDIEKQQLTITRDRYGVKPLYYYYNPEKRVFVFSSEIKSILPLIPSQSISAHSLSAFLTLRYNPSPDTIYDNISKVSPGEIVVLDLNDFSFKKKRNINLPIVVKPDNSKSEQYWIDELNEKIEIAVKRQLMSDVPVGSFLSGGIDSALITVIAQKHSGEKIKTFCVGFKGALPKDDETKEARISAQIIGTEHYETIIEPKDYLSFLSMSTYFLDEPNGSAATMAQYQVSRLASKYVKVCLAGQGADEILLGYPRYQAELDREKYLPLLKIAANFKFIFNFPKLYRYKRAIASLLEEDELKRFIKIYTVFQENELKKLLVKRPVYNAAQISLSSFYNELPKQLYSVDKMSLLDTYTWLPDELLMYGDKMTMATSLEMRVPFLDNDIVELIQKIPHSFKIRNKSSKYILKEVAKKWLPQEIINRPKKGFVMPILQWFQSDMHDEISSILLSDKAYSKDFFNQKYIEELLFSYKSKKENDYRKLLLILHFEMFLKNFKNNA